MSRSDVDNCDNEDTPCVKSPVHPGPFLSLHFIMDNAMDIDDPNRRYVSPFLTIRTHTLAQTDDDVLVHVLYFLAKAVPDHSVAVLIEGIKNLNMLDLRPLLVAV